jgi:hypothetical protein
MHTEWSSASRVGEYNLYNDALLQRGHHSLVLTAVGTILSSRSQRPGQGAD